MLNNKTEMQINKCFQSVLNFQKDIVMIDGRNRKEIYSIDDDNNLYLFYKKNGERTEFTPKLIRNNVKTFAATNIAKTNQVAIACCIEDDVCLVKTESPESVEEKDFVKLDFSGVLGGKKLVPSRLLLSALDSKVTLFVEMRDDNGLVEQFSCLLSDQEPYNIRYFPLATNFSAVIYCAAGRAINQYVDGAYFFGMYGKSSQLIYSPSYNVFGSTPPAPIRLKSDYKIDCICSLPLKAEIGTHLFCVGEKKLYFYPFDRQKDMSRIDNPNPDCLISSEFFCNAKKIAANRSDDAVYVYILNQMGQLCFTYAKCKDEYFDEFVKPVIMKENVFYFDVCDQGVMNICQGISALFGKYSALSGEWEFDSTMLPD